MMLVLRDDLVIEIFESAPTLRDGIEVIDVENEEYQFCDQNGQRYVGVVTEKSGWFSSGNFELRPEGTPDINNALRLLDSAVDLEPNKKFADLESLRAYLLKTT
jgi:hypothetical protein